MRFIEIRSYNLYPGMRHAFHQLVMYHSLPMLEQWNIDVVAFGPSPHDDDSYYLIRAYRDLDDRQQSQDAFYGSAEWRQGPRESIVSMIASDTSIVLELDDEVVDGLRSVVGPSS